MHLRGFHTPLWIRCAGVVYLALVVSPAFGQSYLLADNRSPACPPPCLPYPVPLQQAVPTLQPTPAQPTAPPTQPEQRPQTEQRGQTEQQQQQQPQEPNISPEQSAAAGGESVAL